MPDFHRARLDSGDLPALTPIEYRADAVVVLSSVSGDAALAVVIEVQLGKDTGKRWSWPVYLATLRARLRCPVVLLVVCADAAATDWCATPIELGHPGWDLRPLVLGPDRVPIVTDAEHASRMPELAVLSAIAHGAGPAGEQVLEATASALAGVDDEHLPLYSEVVLAALPEAARHYMEAMMSATGIHREYKTDFVRRHINRGRAEGQAIGEAKALLAVLSARGIDVPEAARTRITEVADLGQLETWIRRAVTADSVEDLFG